MSYRYFTWRDSNGYFNCNKLLDEQQIHIILNELLQKPKLYDIYATIQEYDKDCNILSCPIYADFDGITALEDTREYVKKIESELGIYPKIYFSGKKGFHVIIPYNIVHPKCHLVAQKLVNMFGSYMSLDNLVYTSRRLLRINNSYHTTGNLFKVQLSPEELNLFSLDEIKSLATSQRQYLYTEIIPASKIEVLDHWRDVAIKEVESVKVTQQTCMPDNGSWLENLTPCLRSMLEIKPDDGYMNATVFTLSKFLKYYSVDLNEAISLFLSYSHYSHRESTQHDVVKVIRNVYRSEIYNKVGCRYGSDSAVMRRHCDVFCRYNDKEVNIKFA